MKKSRWQPSSAAVYAVVSAVCALCLVSHAAAAGQPNLNWDFSPVRGVTPPARYQYAWTLYNGDPIIYGGTSGNLRSFSELNDLWRYSVAKNLWEPITVAGPSPPGLGRYGATLDAVGDKLYLFGGANSVDSFNDVWIFDMTQLRWTPVTQSPTASVPTPRSSHRSVIRSGNTIVIYGGQSPYGPVRDMWSFNTLTLTWTLVPTTNVPALPAGFQFLGGEGFCGLYRAATDSLITFGGTPRLTGESVNSNYVVEFNFATSNWTRWDVGFTTSAAVDIPIRRQFASCFVFGDQLYVSGGWSDSQQRSLGGVYRLNLQTRVWTFINGDVNTELPGYTGQAPTVRDSANFVYIPDGTDPINNPGLALLAFGWGSDVYNDMFQYDIAQNRWTRKRDNAREPAPRVGHSWVAHRSSILLFGGDDGKGGLMNDVWSFETVNGTWTQFSVPGEQPDPRRGHAAVVVGDVMFVFGGVTGSLSAASDLWSFDINAGTWSAVTPVATSDLPDARSGHAMGSVGLYLYVVAGSGNVETMNDIWQYDIVNAVWAQIDAGTRNNTLTGRFDFGFHQFQNPFTHDQTFIVFGGLDDGFTELNDLWMWRFNTSSWTRISTGPSNGLLTRSGNPTFASGTRVLSHGGQNYADLLSELVEFDVFQNTTGFFADKAMPVPTTSDPVRQPQYLAGHTVARVRDNAYYFGGFTALSSSVSTANTAVPSLVSNRVFRLGNGPLCATNPNAFPVVQSQDPTYSGSSSCFLCAAGSYYSAGAGGACVDCAAGKYAENAGQSQCTECPAGFFSPFTGMGSSLSCQSCPAGTFNNATGASACTPCPADRNCPPASTNPNPRPNSLNQGVAVQPSALEAKQNQVQDQQFILLMTGIALLGFCLIVMALLPAAARDAYLPPVDMFTKQHIPLTQEQRVLKEWQTPMGGAVAVIMTILVVFFIVEQCLVWQDNELETRSLIPNIVTSSTTYGRIVVNLDLQNYGGACAADPSQYSPCLDANIVSLSGIVGGAGNSSYELLCAAQCRVRWTCFNCTLAVAEGAVQFTWNRAYSFATAIGYSVITTSGIYDAVSSYSGLLSTETDAFGKQKTFRGGVPSNLNFKLTQTEFNDFVNSYNDTGYHTEFVTATPGSQVTSQQFQYVRGMSVRFTLTKADASFLVVRNPVLNPVTFTSNLLGGVSGMMAAMGLLLAVLEKYQLRRQREKLEALEAEIGKPLPWGLPFATSFKEADGYSNCVEAKGVEDWVMDLVFDRAKKFHFAQTKKHQEMLARQGSLRPNDIQNALNRAPSVKPQQPVMGGSQDAVTALGLSRMQSADARPSATGAAAGTTPGGSNKPSSAERAHKITADVLQQWECDRCTFLNKAGATKCTICDFQRDGAADRKQA